MEHAKKMILVEPSVLERMHNQSQIQPNVINHLDIEMEKILNLKNINDNEKWTMYNQTLQRYLNIMNRSREPITIPLIESGEGKNIGEFTQNILGPLPKTVQAKAIALLNILTNNGVTWNEMGNVIYNGDLISGSNIIDLVTDMMKSSKSSAEPVGWKSFADILCKINVPRTLIVNQKRLKYINEKSGLKIEKQETKKEQTNPTYPNTRQSVAGGRTRRRQREKFSWTPYDRNSSSE